MSKKHIINDIIMTSAALFVALVWFLFNLFSGTKSSTCNIYLNNELIDTVSLYENGNYLLYTDGKVEKEPPSLGLIEESIICFTVEDGYLSVIDANCADKLCAHQPSISKENDTIVCLPNKVVFTVDTNVNNVNKEEKTEYDGFTN